MGEYEKLKAGIKTLQEKLEKQEVYYRGWNGGAANYNARLKGELDELKNTANRLLTLATKYCPRNHHDWEEILKISKKF